MPIPIIFIHHTDDDYLPYVLGQAKLANPRSDVLHYCKRHNAALVVVDPFPAFDEKQWGEE